MPTARRFPIKLSICVPTIGRETLRDTLESILPTLGDNDCVFVMPDMRAMDQSAMERGTRIYDEVVGWDERFTWEPYFRGNHQNWGHGQRNKAIWLTSPGYHFCSIDDDDVYTLNALAHFRLYAMANPGKPLVFRMRMPEGHLIWTDGYRGEMMIGNYGTPCFLVPRTKGQTAQPYYGLEYAGDATYIANARRILGEPVFIDSVVAVIKPKG